MSDKNSMNIGKWNKWSIVKEKSGIRIRRFRTVQGKRVWETLDKKQYEHLTSDQYQGLLNRLNASRLIEEAEAKKRYDFDSSFIPKSVLEDFHKSILNKINDKNSVTTITHILNEYTFKFFIHKNKLPNPNKWPQYEDRFITFLLSDKKSASYLKRIIQTTNRFLKFLHKTNPEEIKLIVFEQISKVKLPIKESNTRLKFISEETYKTICNKIDPSLLSAVKISYYFGLRCAEVLGLETQDVYEDCLDVKRQLIRISPNRFTGPLKSKVERSVPYWFSNPEEVYNLIETTTEMHPDTLSKKFSEEMTRLKLPFEFHDLRRTFITNALRKFNMRDVQLAAGHSDLKTTMLYAQDDRQLQRKKFKPNRLVSVK